MYQIFVDRFCNGDHSNNVMEQEYVYVGRPVHFVDRWDQNPSTMDVGCFYGGDLQGVWDKLDYLQDLGVNAIELMPIFEFDEMQDYRVVDGKVLYEKNRWHVKVEVAKNIARVIEIRSKLRPEA